MKMYSVYGTSKSFMGTTAAADIVEAGRLFMKIHKIDGEIAKISKDYAVIRKTDSNLKSSDYIVVTRI